MQLAERVVRVRAAPAPPWLAALAQPRFALPLLIVLQWAAVALFALRVPHNGWLFYQGGDETAYYTSAWVLAEGHVPRSDLVGYGWPYLLAPFALAAGPSFLAAVPAIVAFQVVVLLPAALLAAFGVGRWLGGPRLGSAAAALWVAFPYLSIAFFDERYYDRYVDLFLPQALGLSGLADFPSLVALAVAGYLVLRSLEGDDPAVPALAGLVAGFAIGIKPSNALFLAGPALAFALARRWGAGAAFSAGLVAPVLAFLVWKQQGLGKIPFIMAAEEVRVAAGPGLGLVADPATWLERVAEHYPLEWDHLRAQHAQLREFAWSMRVFQALPLVGLLAVARRSVPAAGLLGGWLAAYLLVKGSFEGTTVDGGSFFRHMMPAFPAFFALVVAIPLLVPGLGGRIAAAGRSVTGGALSRRRAILAPASLVLGVGPLALLLVLSALPEARTVHYAERNLVLPVDAFALEASADGGAVELDWRPQTSGVAFYDVFRSPVRGPAEDPDDPEAVEGLSCRLGDGAADCGLEMELLGRTAETSWRDEPPAGEWTYRAALVGAWVLDPPTGDALVLSRPRNVHVPAG